MQISKFIIGVAVCFFLVGCAIPKNQPKQPPVPVPTPQRTGGSAEKQNPSSEKKYSSTGAQKPEESVDKDGKTEKEPPTEVPTTDIDPVSSKLDQLKSTDEEIQQQVNQLTLQILQNKLGETQKTLEGLKNKNTNLQTEIDRIENLPLIKRIKELQEQIKKKQQLIDYLDDQLAKKRERQRLAALEGPSKVRQQRGSKKQRTSTTTETRRKQRPSQRATTTTPSTPKKSRKTKKSNKKVVPPRKRTKPVKPKKKPKHIPKPKPTWRIGSGRIIVVSLSNSFGGQQKTIRNGFFEVLKAKKGRSRSFTLYTIQSGRQSRTLLTSRQLRSLSVEGGSHSILGKLEMGMRFGATDLWALSDLSRLIGKKRTQIGSVLYITDNKRINAANQKQRDILLKWKKAGGRLKVLTTGSCSVWQQVGATCRNISNLKGTLRGFI